MLPQLLLSKEKNISLAMAQPPLSIAIMVLRRNATYANKNQLLYKKHLYTDLYLYLITFHIPCFLYSYFMAMVSHSSGIFSKLRENLLSFDEICDEL